MTTSRFSSVASSVAFSAALMLLAMLFASSCTSAKKKEEGELHARIGTAFLQQGRYPDALRELLEAEKLDPRNTLTQNNLGLAYFLREKYQLAAEHIQRAIDLDPKYSEARNNYGRVLIELGRYDEAIAQLRMVLSDLTYNDPTKALVNIGMAQFRKGDYAQARSTFSKAIQANRENCLAQTLYGRSLFEMGQFSGAANALDNANIVCHSNNQPGFDEPPYFSGLAYYKLGNTSSAVSRLEDVVKFYPGSRYAKKAQDLLRLMK
jgi:type IV pilus assembly protein PilF